MNKQLVFSGDLPTSTIADRVRRGQLAQLARGVYTNDLDHPIEDVARANIFEIVGRLLPDAVITDRSARTGGLVDNVLYVVRDGRPRDIDLPGITVRARSGAGPQPGDIPYPGGLHLASRARGLVENTRPSRSRGRGNRSLTETELGDWIDYICTNDGPEQLEKYRRQAEVLAPSLGVDPQHLAIMQALIGIAVGTRPDTPTGSAALRSRRRGSPIDQARVKRFELLAETLQRAAPQSRPRQVGKFLPFFEAYFSNFIEGTEFEVDEAARIVFDGEIPKDRPADAHDVLGTYRLVADPNEMELTGTDPNEFLSLVRRRNAAILEGRPDKRPGNFKELANRTGATSFVDPQHVEGTLRAGFRLRDQLDTAWERAVYVAFVVAEVHPFDDGNGRTARVMMNAELHAGGESRIIIPTVFRQDYLDGLRRLSRQDDPSIFIKAMRYAHDFTASINFSDYSTTKQRLIESNAFNEPDSADRLRVLTDVVEQSSDRPWRA